MTTKRSAYLLVIFSSAVLLSLGGCGEDGDPTQNQIPVDESDAGADADDEPDIDESDADAGDIEADPCEEMTCEAPEICVAGVCELEVDEGYGCSVPQALGELDADGSVTITADPTDQANQQNVGCSTDDQSPEAVFSFSVSGPTFVSLELEDTQYPLVMEVREEACADTEAALVCAGGAGDNFYAEADITYYIIVEARTGWNVGEFGLKVDTESQVCAPPGSWSCDGEGQDRVQCYGGSEERVHECAADCGDGQCYGETCAHALEVTASTTITGDLTAYQSEINLEESPTCSTEGTTGPSTPGQDVVVYLPNLAAGQVVMVETENSTAPTAIAITDSCEATPNCVAADSTTGTLTWEVVEEGDYYLILDAMTTLSGEFVYEIEILQ